MEIKDKNKTSKLQLFLVPQRPTPELVDRLGDPRRVAEDRHVRGVVEHQQLGPRLRRNGRRGTAKTTRPVGATLEHAIRRVQSRKAVAEA